MGDREETTSPSPSRSLIRDLGTLSTLGIHLVVTTFLGLALGYQLDRWLDTAPIFLLVFFAAGIVAGFRHIFRVARQLTGTPPGG